MVDRVVGSELRGRHLCLKPDELTCTGKKLAQDVKDAIAAKKSVLDIPRGVYRISDAERGTGEALMLCDSENFTFRGPGVEIICELEGSHARVLGNKNLTLEGIQPASHLLIKVSVTYC